MPFISRDWRSPGEEWVKTEEGWEKKKILEFESSPRSITSCLDEDEIDKTDSFSDSAAATGDNKENLCCEGQTDVQKQRVCSLPQPVPDVNRSALHRDAMAGYTPPPYCQITVKPSREVGGYTGFSEVIKRLDFKSALHDIRRFNYVCKLLELLINDSLVSLAGTAQRVVFSLLEELAISVSNNKSNLRLLNKLLTTLRIILTEHYCFGHLLGSTPLWEQHQQAIDRVERVNGDIHDQLDRPDTDRFQLAGLPTECLREVVLCLDSHQDLDCSSRAFSPLADIIEESRIWRQLCQYHFSHQQIASAAAATPALATPLAATPALATPLAATPALVTPLAVSADASEVDKDTAAATETVLAQQVDWQTLYHRLRRRHGLREEYTETVMLCRTCRCLFWRCFGHPCTTPTAATTGTCTAGAAVVPAMAIPTADPQMSAEERSRQHIPIPPQTFLTFFSL